MDFHEVRFPANLSFGSVGGPIRHTDVVALANGFEERNTPWAHSRRRYDAGMAMRSLDDLKVLIAFFEARLGQMYGFRWKDWADYKSCTASAAPAFGDQLIGTGDGATIDFQLSCIYQSGGHSYARPITKPVPGTVLVGQGGAGQSEGTDFSVDTTTGLITFTVPPSAGQDITAGFEFDVPVRFDNDRINISMASFQAGEVPDVPVIEVRV